MGCRNSSFYEIMGNLSPKEVQVLGSAMYSVQGLGQDTVNLVLDELKIKFTWKGKGINEKCFDDLGNCIVACDKEYFRPLEVDTLLGDSRKARKELNWKPKTSIKELVREMVDYDFKKIANDQL